MVEYHDGTEWGAPAFQQINPDETSLEPFPPPTTNIEALESEGIKRIYFLWLDFAGDTFRACTGTRDYDALGYTWLGIGEISGISDIAHAADIAARPITFTLSGAGAYLNEILQSRTNYKNRAAELYCGLLDRQENLIQAPFPLWRGRMDVGSTISGETNIAQVSCEPLAARLLRPNVSRYSDQDHQMRHPGDKFFEFLAQMENKDVTWGGQRVGPGGGGGRGNDDFRDRTWTIER